MECNEVTPTDLLDPARLATLRPTPKKNRKPGSRKTSPRPSRGKFRNPKFAIFKREQWKDPVYRAKQTAAIRAGNAKRKGGNSFRAGVPDGMRKEEAMAKRAKATVRAAEIVETLINYELLPKEDERGATVLREACAIALSPGNATTKLAAARLFLDFTKAKPAASTVLTVNKHEDWLAEVEKEMTTPDESKSTD